MKAKNSSLSGFTLPEVLFLGWFILWLCIVIGGVYTICVGNFWYTDASVEHSIRFSHPDVTTVLVSERHIWTPSVIHVETKDGQREAFDLDTNVLWNYRFTDERPEAIPTKN